MSSYSDEKHLDNGGVRWVLTDEERQHIAGMLDAEASSLARVTGNIMTAPRMTCSKCGKRSGLDDLVHNALDLGVHEKDFMMDVLLNGPKGDSPEHLLNCSRCSEQFERSCSWMEENCGAWVGHDS